MGIWIMLTSLVSLIVLAVIVACEQEDQCSVKPNIVFFLADDMGWNDIGWNNGDVYTPNLDQLARDGIILNQSYFLPLCTPSRASLLTGYYGFRTGMHDDVLTDTHPVGLPLQFATMADKLREQGYATHLIGKWNLGYCSWKYTPTYRGFDSFFGFYASVGHQYNHTTFVNRKDPDGQAAYDFRNNTEVAWGYHGIHSSIPFVKQAKLIMERHNATKPLFLFFSSPYPHLPHEVPEHFENLYNSSSVKNQFRRKFMARMTALDHDVGEVVSALKKHGLYENSVIAFSSDNGGGHTGGGSNHPLRGTKATLYEGGTRVPGFFHSPQLLKKGFTYNGLMHAVDWLPTFVGIAGGKSDPALDGINMWPHLANNLPSPRNELIYNLVATESEFRGAIRMGDWKLIIGQAGTPAGWYEAEEAVGKYFHNYFELDTEVDLTTNYTLQLYNLADDPTETSDLSQRYPRKVKQLYEDFEKYKQGSVLSMKYYPDPRGDPVHFDRVFTPGFCEPLYHASDMNYA